MTALNGTPKLAATAIAAMLLVVGCGGASEQANDTPVAIESTGSGIDGSELTGVRLDVRRDPG